MNVLISGVGGPTARSVAVALKNHSRYKSFRLIGVDADPLSIGLYQLDLFDQTQVIPSASDPQYWPSIEQLIDRAAIDCAVILPEAEVREWSRRMNGGTLPCRSLIPDLPAVDLLLDKAATAEVLAPFDLAPRSVSIARDQSNFANLGDRLGWPLWIRAVSGTSGAGALRVDNLQMLRNWMAIHSAVPHFVASQYLPGRNLACKLLYFEGALVRAACAERVTYVMSRAAPSGITGNTSFGRLLSDSAVVSVASRAMDRVFTHTGSAKHGLFTVDLKEDDRGRALVTEVNVRHVAFTQCFAAAGANLVEDSIRLVDRDPEFNPQFVAYEFSGEPVFLRDVDALPILMDAARLLSPAGQS